MQIFSSANLYCQISTVSADGKAKTMGEGDVDVGVSGARVERQEGNELGKEFTAIRRL
jgi:hypothetical protein